MSDKFFDSRVLRLFALWSGGRNFTFVSAPEIFSDTPHGSDSELCWRRSRRGAPLMFCGSLYPEPGANFWKLRSLGEYLCACSSTKLTQNIGTRAIYLLPTKIPLRISSLGLDGKYFQSSKVS